MIREFLSRWPLIQQLRTGADGTGAEAMTDRTRNLRPKTNDAEVARSICPYCGSEILHDYFSSMGKKSAHAQDEKNSAGRTITYCVQGSQSALVATEDQRLQRREGQMKRRRSSQPTNQPHGAVIYVRVSTDEQAEGTLNLKNQEQKCRDFCLERGYAVLMVFIDPGQSARTADRPKFRRMIAYCKAHQREIGCVVVQDLSRFARNNGELISLLSLRRLECGCTRSMNLT